MKKLISLFCILFSTAIFSQDRFEKIDEYLNYLNENNKFMGSVSLREGNQVVFSKAYGCADVQTQTKADIQTKYKIGSITKIFTATIIMQLIEEKKLRLESKLTKFYPKVKNADKISIADLLHHRTGIIDYINQDSLSVEDFSNSNLKQVIYDKINNYESLFEPGSKFVYSNSNYYLLGGIIEKLTQASYEKNLEDRIINKLGLKNTYYPSGKTDTTLKESYSYLYNGSEWEKIPEWGNNVAYAAGEILSTPDDLTLFMYSLMNGKLLKDNSLTQMKELKDGYGLALMQFPFGERKFYGHTGGIEGFRSVVGYYPNDNLAVSLIVNGDNFNRNDIMIGILSIYYKIPFPFPSFKKIDASVLQKYVGIYSSKDIPLKINIAIKNDELTAQATGQSAFVLTPRTETEFVFQTAGVEIIFEGNQFTLKQGGQKFVFTKD